MCVVYIKKYFLSSGLLGKYNIIILTTNYQIVNGGPGETRTHCPPIMSRTLIPIIDQIQYS
jgi:hypothetical protein